MKQQELDRQFKLRQQNAGEYKREGNNTGGITVEGNVIRRNGKVIGFVRDPGRRK